MKHQDWKDRWLNKPIDFDNAYGAQCVDVMRQYASDVHGITNIEGVRGAADFFTQHANRPNQRAAYFAIAYQEGLEAPQGAFIVWGANSGNGNFGHVAVCDASTQTGITILDQDGFDNPTRNVNLGSANGLRKRTVNYNNVLGWLVLRQDRNPNPSTTTTPAAGIRILATPPVGLQLAINDRYPPANAVYAPSDTNGRVGEYWRNPNSLQYMVLTTSGWRNI